VAQAINAKGGPTISGTYLWMLRTGQRDNPTKSHLEALAEFFGVSPAYFFDDAAAERIEAQLELLAAMRDAQVSEIALRAFGLSEATLKSIVGIIEGARTMEGLPPGDPQGKAVSRGLSRAKRVPPK
jgi:transcriptional regulator with XRE-family HTH domain